MKLCSECKHYKKMVLEFGGHYDVCLKKSEPSDVNYINGVVSYDLNTVTTIKNERRDSKGFFGLFIDETRCGKQGLNFEPKEFKE